MSGQRSSSSFIFFNLVMFQTLTVPPRLGYRRAHQASVRARGHDRPARSSRPLRPDRTERRDHPPGHLGEGHRAGLERDHAYVAHGAATPHKPRRDGAWRRTAEHARQDANAHAAPAPAPSRRPAREPSPDGRWPRSSGAAAPS